MTRPYESTLNCCGAVSGLWTTTRLGALCNRPDVNAGQRAGDRSASEDSRALQSRFPAQNRAGRGQLEAAGAAGALVEEEDFSEGVAGALSDEPEEASLLELVESLAVISEGLLRESLR